MSPILHATAAGNGDPFGNPINNDASPHHPSSYALDNIIAVAATDDEDLYASFSNYGATSVDLAAPGVGIFSTVLGDGYGSYSGTSMATPHVAGAAALILEQYSNLTAVQLKQVLVSNINDISTFGANAARPTITGGRLNVLKVLTALNADAAPPTAVRGWRFPTLDCFQSRSIGPPWVTTVRRDRRLPMTCGTPLPQSPSKIGPVPSKP